MSCLLIVLLQIVWYMYINCCLLLSKDTRVYLSSVLGMTVMSMSVRHFDNMHVMQLLDCRKQSWLHKYASYSSQEGRSPFPDTKKTGYKWFERKSKGTYPNTLLTHQGLTINNFHQAQDQVRWMSGEGQVRVRRSCEGQEGQVKVRWGSGRSELSS